MKKIQKQNKGLARRSMTEGFTLVETLVAISIFTMSILGLISVLAQGISNTHYAKQKMIASYLAQEGIEYIRNMRDTYVLYTGVPGNGWPGFKADLALCNDPKTGNPCGFDTVFPHDVFICNLPNDCRLYVNNGKYSPDSSGTDSGFTRTIWMDPSTDEVKIYSKVEWAQGSGNYSIIFSESLFNWVE